MDDIIQIEENKSDSNCTICKDFESHNHIYGTNILECVFCKEYLSVSHPCWSVDGWIKQSQVDWCTQLIRSTFRAQLRKKREEKLKKQMEKKKANSNEETPKTENCILEKPKDPEETGNCTICKTENCILEKPKDPIEPGNCTICKRYQGHHHVFDKHPHECVVCSGYIKHDCFSWGRFYIL